MPKENCEAQRIGRRSFMHHGVLTLAVGSLSDKNLLAHAPSEPLRFGILTDLHYADKPPAGTRYYRQTLAKLREAASQFAKAPLAFVVELGDLIDAADSVETEQSYLATINGEFSKICPERHYVLGNHCVDTLTKREFLAGVEQQESYYSFDRQNLHFIVLDACFRKDGKPYERKNFEWTDSNLPTSELAWLESDLNATDKPVIVFAHQRIDVTKNHSVKNNAQVRKLLEKSGKVLAVFQGHSHENDLQDIEGIHYCTLVAMVEGSGETNNAYSIASLNGNGDISLSGFRKQQSRQWHLER